MVEEKNPYLILGFWEFAITSTLFVVFFPWSLLYMVIFHGMDDTKQLLQALAHDFLSTVLAVLAVIFVIVVVTLVLFSIFS